MLFVAFVAIAAFVVVFRLGSRASAGVTLADPVVWVEDGARGRILQINGSTREITASVDVTENNSESLAALPNGRDAVYLNRTAGEYGEISAVDLQPANQTDTDVGSLDDALFLGELDPDTGQHTSFVISSENVLIYNSGSTEPLNIPVSDGLGDVVTTPTGQLVAVTADSAQLLISDPTGLVRLAELPEPASVTNDPIGLVRAGESIYVVDSSRRTVQEVDTVTGEFGDATSVCGSLTDASIGGNVLTESDGVHRVLVHDATAGVLSVSNPAEGDCIEISLSETGSSFGPPVAVDSIAYLPNYATGQVVVVDIAERVVSRTHAFTPVRDREFELEVFDGVVWANEPNGVRAAVISPNSITPISKQQNVRVIGVGDDGDEAVGGDGIADNAEGQRVFGEDGDLFEGFAQDTDTTVADATVSPVAGEDAQIVGEGGEEFVEGELIGGEIAELVNAPVIVEPADLAEGDETLLANFNFSAEVLLAGEEVRLTDASTGNPTQWNWDFGDGTSGEGPEVSKVWDEEGVYTVTMFIANDAGDEALQTHNFTVVAPDIALPPSANFSFVSATIEVGEELTFTSTSTGDPETLLWTFGDGTSDVGQSVTKIFDSPGAFEVTLTATNAEGSDSDNAIITVVPGGLPPQAVIATIPTVIDVGQTIGLTSDSTNSPTATSWNFGDGSVDFGTEVFHAWDEPGEYRITLTVSNATGEDSTFRTIFVEPAIDPPVARFSESALTVIAGESLSFSDLSLNSPSSLVWEFGDGTTAQGANVTNIWTEPGQYTVTLTVSNEAGEDSAAKTVTVLPIPVDPPVANFRIPNSATVSVGELISFEDTSQGDPTSWSWRFGDGTAPSSAQNPAHAFSVAGTYEVELTATNDGGSSRFSRTIVVIEPPVADFTRSINELTVSLTDTSTNSPTVWSWDFGDGTTRSGRRAGDRSPTKTYASPGTYAITLIATNEAGDSTPFTTVVTVAELPDAVFSVATSGLSAQFTDLTANGPTEWSWDFGDGVTVANPLQNPTYTYAASGTYQVRLTATNVAGSDTFVIPVTVQLAPPVAAFTCVVAPAGAGVACDASGSTGATAFGWNAPDAIAGTQTGGGPAAGATPSFTFPGNGTYPITLTASNAAGLTDTLVQTVTINLPVPVVQSISPPTNNGGTVTFAAAATNSPTSWTWNAGGGTIQSGGTTSSPVISFPSTGSYTVQAVATNANGSSAPVSHTISVVLAPSVTAVSQTNQAPGEVQLTPTNVNGPTNWSWNVPGSNEVSLTTQTPSFTFASNGLYPATVTVTNSAGSSTFNFDVNVTTVPVVTTTTTTTTTTAPPIPPPTATFTASLASPVITATYTGTSQPGATFAWTIDNGATPATSTSAGPVNFTVPVSPGPVAYTITLTVTDAGGTASASAVVNVP